MYGPRLLVGALLCSLAYASILDTILAAFESAVDCGSCHVLLVALNGLADLGNSTFVDVLTTVCKDLKVSTPFLSRY
jgi:sphingomyelin phosphodiesterase